MVLFKALGDICGAGLLAAAQPASKPLCHVDLGVSICSARATNDIPRTIPALRSAETKTQYFW